MGPLVDRRWRGHRFAATAVAALRADLWTGKLGRAELPLILVGNIKVWNSDPLELQNISFAGLAFS
jgi:hypothetical protein